MSGLDEILEAYKKSQLSLEEACEALSRAHTVQLGHTIVDLHRERRVGAAEVIYAPGKTPKQLSETFIALARKRQNVLATRADAAGFAAVRRELPQATFNETAGTIVHVRKPPSRAASTVAVVSAGTSDQRVAEEAVVTAEFYGNPVTRITDVGVAGLHRLLARIGEIETARVVIVVAGMEGALPSVIAGLIRAPVIAVPTSVGYGASFGGITALLGMLNSCASAVSVVNIDNGFGAGYIASLINRADMR
ncbi:MAG: 1-(5-phosphoribosyl)-5-amino-4-imidazole-carboxylate carboxylase [Betaproteobacteria bacterium RIFCSPLOWO2_12_FULL_65_14]|nr:MAG: 1-(5-phosphoribosyl)-5-amino-4-imidazole-carboxylate carboxylase [Betaproteobacteria bacterium RIFCSPLOWO2_12_FULL_65_14]